MSLKHLFRIPGNDTEALLRKVHSIDSLSSIESIQSEFCYNIALTQDVNDLSKEDWNKLNWLFVETFQPENIASSSFLQMNDPNFETFIEVGPRMAFTTAWSSNCVSMCHACGIHGVTRIERSRRFLIRASTSITSDMIAAFSSLIHDRMTECVYESTLTSLGSGISPEKVTIIPILSEGRAALQKINNEKGLGFDDWDLDFYTNMFIEKLKRNPTDVECFDLGQSNSEHSRHWFFGGNMVIDGETKPGTLFSMVKSTLPKDSNSVIAFHDNSSAIEGFEVPYFLPSNPSEPSAMITSKTLIHPILTAETHNFPSGVAPFPGAETGTGGRLRDVQATGRGAHTLAGISAYCVGNLHIPGHSLPWEQDVATTPYAANLAHPLAIEIEASNGASDYGNKYGEPVVAGFTRSFGQRLPNGERVEFIKPIMFTAGIGLLNDSHRSKLDPEEGMVVCKIGGPAYRIGMGGGAASSRVQGTADAALDFNAVQRGDAEMENRMNRVIRACIDMLDKNPIISIHDQGAGGNGNVLKEIVDPLGARYDLRAIPCGDDTMSVSEIWGAEYQENNAFLVREADLALVKSIAKRENCSVAAVGKVTNDGRVVVVDSKADDDLNRIPYDLPLSLILGNMPKKTFTFTSPIKVLDPLNISASVSEALTRVLRSLDVGSKRFLTNKVDRSVTGLIAQQQAVGPLLTPLSNVAVVALSHFDIKGIAVAVGEQPIKGLVNNKAQANMTVGETFTNLVFAKITRIEDVKMSGNWMWAAKMEGEGAKMWETCEALKDALLTLGASIDGGKDSLSMAAKVIGGETVKSPGTLTLTAYAACPDITLTVTPDLKQSDNVLLLVDLSQGYRRCGGTALATCFSQLGNETPNVSDFDLLKRAFNVSQEIIEKRLFQSGHDRSDGGLVVTIVEMALAGNFGVSVNLNANEVNSPQDVLEVLFHEELGLVFEVKPNDVETVLANFASVDVPCSVIGKVNSRGDDELVSISINNTLVVNESLHELRKHWEATSFALEKLQCNPQCVLEEEQGLIGDVITSRRQGIRYNIPTTCHIENKFFSSRPRIAVLRQEGSNGDREMLAAFHAAGCEAWDVNMNDLLNNRVSLDQFKGIAFCGGFSYADVNDSAKGWAGVIKFNESLLAQFNWFRDQVDRFSLGVCNGCQLMALLGWVPFPGIELGVQTISEDSRKDTYRRVLGDKDWNDYEQPRFLHNRSGRYESRWVALQIQKSPAMLLQGLEGATLGVWVAHGEGRVHFPNPSHQGIVESENLVPLRYVDDNLQVTETYPLNPNGSSNGIAALCSPDGRHLAMMPHPERCFQLWQWPYKPSDYNPSSLLLQNSDKELKILPSPWLKLFQNARNFCEQK